MEVMDAIEFIQGGGLLIEEMKLVDYTHAAISLMSPIQSVNSTSIGTGHSMNHYTLSSEDERSIISFEETVKNYLDPFGPYQIQRNMDTVSRLWENVIPLSPIEFLTKLLRYRGYSSPFENPIKAYDHRKVPSQKQVSDYTSELVIAVRQSNITRLRQLQSEGVCMNACNVHGESIVHLACRRASFETVHFILKHGGDPYAVDDFGRTPFHDACWRTDPRFDIIVLLLKYNDKLLCSQDIRGAFALSYIIKENWLQWCAFLFHLRDVYWPHQGGMTDTI